MKLSRLPIGGKDRAKCNALTFDAGRFARCRTDHGSGCNELQEQEIQNRLAIAVAITMSFHLSDLAGFIGVVLIIVAYLLLQLEKLPSSSPRYSLLNAAGALLIIISLIFAFNLSAFIVEAFWFLISLMGLLRSLRGGKHSKRGEQWPQ